MNYSRTISLILISSLIFSACSPKKSKESAGLQAASVEKAVIPVKVITLAKNKISRTCMC